MTGLTAGDAGTLLAGMSAGDTAMTGLAAGAGDSRVTMGAGLWPGVMPKLMFAASCKCKGGVGSQADNSSRQGMHQPLNAPQISR